MPDKALENRLRRQADRCGLNARRNPNYELYALLDVQTGGAITPP